MGIAYHELIIVLIVGLLLFGKKLPEVARSLGKGITEFKRGMHGIEDEFRSASNAATSPRPASRPAAEDRPAEITAPKFEPPKFEPTESGSTNA